MKRFAPCLTLLMLLVACRPEVGFEAPISLPIRVDATDASRGPSLISFFPRDSVARPGDTLVFEVEGVGEPHVIAMGTLVNEGLAALDRVKPATLKEYFLGEPEEMYKLPSVFAATADYRPENQAAGQPCFLDSGDPPMPDACPERDQPAFDGTQSFYSSGMLREGSDYQVPLAEDLAPGTYRFMCLIHRGTMSGQVKVVGEETERPGAEDASARARREISTSLANLEPATASAGSATSTDAVAGTESGKSPFELAMIFGPDEVTIPAGDSITWRFTVCHTISFNPPAEAFGDLKKEKDGSVRLNPMAYTPSQAPPVPALSFDPSAPPLDFDAGTWDGNGFFNSGGICALAKEDFSYKLTFSRPGDYELRCLFHPFMRGTVKVVG